MQSAQFVTALFDVCARSLAPIVLDTAHHSPLDADLADISSCVLRSMIAHLSMLLRWLAKNDDSEQHLLAGCVSYLAVTNTRAHICRQLFQFAGALCSVDGRYAHDEVLSATVAPLWQEIGCTCTGCTCTHYSFIYAAVMQVSYKDVLRPLFEHVLASCVLKCRLTTVDERAQWDASELDLLNE
jgi:hypothetical protein